MDLQGYIFTGPTACNQAKDSNPDTKRSCKDPSYTSCLAFVNQIPLTPALSQREREQLRPLFENCDVQAIAGRLKPVLSHLAATLLLAALKAWFSHGKSDGRRPGHWCPK
jgi:hypothetical protein